LSAIAKAPQKWLAANGESKGRVTDVVITPFSTKQLRRHTVPVPSTPFKDNQKHGGSEIIPASRIML